MSKQVPKLKGDCCRVCDYKFHIKDILKEKSLQIEAQTNQLLGEGGMHFQVDQAEERLMKIVDDGTRQKKLLGKDI